MADSDALMTRPRESDGSTVNPAEVEKFGKLADAWWDPDGPFRPLHKFNPTRLGFIRDRVTRHFSRADSGPRPFDGLRLLDIGCGGGLLSEPMARLGAAVTGIDATERNVRIAQGHADAARVPVRYRHATVEVLAREPDRFDVILNMEVVEHVADIGLFLSCAASLLAPGGIMISATLNRTAKSFALAIVGAEYVLRWLPRGTHNWRDFVRPSELEGALTGAGLVVGELTGVGYNPLRDRWDLSSDVSVNYMLVASRPVP